MVTQPETPGDAIAPVNERRQSTASARCKITRLVAAFCWHSLLRDIAHLCLTPRQLISSAFAAKPVRHPYALAAHAVVDSLNSVLLAKQAAIDHELQLPITSKSQLISAALNSVPVVVLVYSCVVCHVKVLAVLRTFIVSCTADAM